MLAFLKTYCTKLETFKAYPHVKEKILSTERVVISSLSVGNDLPTCFPLSLLFSVVLHPVLFI